MNWWEIGRRTKKSQKHLGTSSKKKNKGNFKVQKKKKNMACVCM